MREPEAKRLLVVILDQETLVEQLVAGFLELGVPGATVVESRGMGQIVREDLPVFAGMAKLFPQTTGSRMILSVLAAAQAAEVMALVNEIIQQRPERHSAVCFTLPVETFEVIAKK
jgi:hypothetical protein